MAEEVKLLIGGELVDGDGERLDVEDPARAEVFASVSLPSDEQVDAAIAAAREAARVWARDAGARALRDAPRGRDAHPREGRRRWPRS